MFFRKWLTRKNRPPIEDKPTVQEKSTYYFEEAMIDDASNKSYVEDTLSGQEKIPYFGDIRPYRQRITLHIVDELTNRRMTVFCSGWLYSR